MSSRKDPSPLLFSRTQTFGAGAIADVDAIKTAIATATTAQSYTGAALNGNTPFANELPGVTKPSRTVSVTRSTSAGSYVQGSKVTFTGTLNGQAQSEEITLPDTNGGDTLNGTKLFDEVTQIDVDAQQNTSGQFEFGADAVGGPGGGVMGIKPNASGNLELEYANGETDSLPGQAGQLELVYPKKLLSSTAIGVSVFV